MKKLKEDENSSEAVKEASIEHYRLITGSFHILMLNEVFTKYKVREKKRSKSELWRLKNVKKSKRNQIMKIY